jgi:hypothetical protein
MAARECLREALPWAHFQVKYRTGDMGRWKSFSSGGGWIETPKVPKYRQIERLALTWERGLKLVKRRNMGREKNSLLRWGLDCESDLHAGRMPALRFAPGGAWLESDLRAGRMPALRSAPAGTWIESDLRAGRMPALRSAPAGASIESDLRAGRMPALRFAPAGAWIESDLPAGRMPALRFAPAGA